MFEGHLFILVILCTYSSTCAINAVYDTGKELWKLYSMIDKIKINSTDDLRQVDDLLGNGLNGEIRYQMDKIHEHLARIEESISSKIIHDWLELPVSEIMLYKCIDTFQLFIMSIDATYGEFRQCMGEGRYHQNLRLQNVTRRIILDMEERIAVIRQIIVDAQEFLPHDKNLPFAISGFASIQFEHICNGPRIISNILVDLFTITIIAEIKVNLMLAFANIHRFTVKEEWKAMNLHAMDQLESHFGKYVTIFEMNLEFTDAFYMRACDPDAGLWIRGASFYELEGTFQTTIFRHHWARCKYDSCNAVWFDKSDRCDPSNYDTRSSCSATIAECTYLRAVQACVLYVKSTELGSLGSNFTCPKDNGYIIVDGTGWEFNFATCACNCYSNHNKISLVTMNSKVKSNMVIIGVRFVRKNNILYIQPREGTLRANGYIARNSGKWLSIPNNNDPSSIHQIDRENRVFFLDDLRLPAGYVLTGIKFNKVTRGKVTGFAIEIISVPFDYESGKLELGADLQMQTHESNGKSGTELSFVASPSVYTTALHKVTPHDVDYVTLKRSDLKNDFGQTTLPLFDAVPVKMYPPSPLGGVGIFHKGLRGYAGFISLRVYGIKYENYFRDFISAHVTNERVSYNQSRRN